MASARVIFLISAICFAVVVVNAQQKSSLDAVDIDAVFRNERLLKNYVDCLLDKKPCSKEGAELKKRVPKVLENNCADCTQSERERAAKSIKLMAAQRPDLWKLVKTKYDPTGDYSAAFSKKYNVQL